MWLQLLKTFNRYQGQWMTLLQGEESITNNPFAFNNTVLWEKADTFLKRYIEIESNKIVEGKRTLVFTHCKEVLFTRYNVDLQAVLVELITYLEDTCQEKVTAIDKAFLEWKIYNEVEEAISYRAIKEGFMKQSMLPILDYYFFVKKMRLLLEVGSTIVFTDLEELYAAYDYKYIWKYNYE